MPTENHRDPPLLFPKEVQTAQLPWKTHSLRAVHALDSPGGLLGKELGGSHQKRGELCCLESRAQSWMVPFAMGRSGFPLIVFNAPAITVQHESLHFLYIVPPSYPHPSTYTQTSPNSSQKLPSKPSSTEVRTIFWVGSAMPLWEQGTERGYRFIQSFVRTLCILQTTECCPWTSRVGIPFQDACEMCPLQSYKIRTCILTRSPDVLCIHERLSSAGLQHSGS